MSTPTMPDDLSVRTQIDEILYSGRNVPPHIRMFLHELERFASAHVCPLPDEEIEFIGKLHARYGRPRSA